MPNTLTDIMTVAVQALRSRDMARVREAQAQVDKWLIDNDCPEHHTAALTALTDALEAL